MKKLKKKDYINLSILIGIFIIIFFILTRFSFIYGSLKDWTSQHYIIPEYFRNLFYNTKQIIPSFAFNLGSGQNIFNMAYYGLFSPFVILSYFFPFISMMYFMIGISILIVISSIILIYLWLYNNNFDRKVCFLSSFVFLLSGPLIFHSHRHIMFISYMPFLIMGLMAIDCYFKSNRRILLMLSIFLIIMSSYFYSVGSLVVLFIYGNYKYLSKLKKNSKFVIKSYLRWVSKFLINFIIPIMMASFFLLPTAYSLLSGRVLGGQASSSLFILIPNINVKFVLYNAYSLGLSIFFIISLVDLFLTKKREYKFLVYVFLLIIVFPIFVFILNGTMYVDSKVLIPFLPLSIFMISNTISNIFKKKYDFDVLINYSIVLILILLLFTEFKYIFLIILDSSIFLLFIYQYSKTREKDLIFIPIIIVSTLSCLVVNLNDDLMSFKQYNDLNISKENKIVREILSKDEEFYRINNTNNPLEKSNKVYNIKEYKSSIYSSVSSNDLKDFYYNSIGNEIIHRSYGMLSGTNNVLYNIYMGNKYYIGDNNLIGYVKDKENDFYKSEDVLPIGYTSGSLMSKKDFLKLDFPYNSEAILKNVIVDDEVKSSFKTSIEKVNLDYIIKSNKGTSINKMGYKTIVRAGKKNKIILEFNKTLKNKILFIKFKVNNDLACRFNDLEITINGVRNKVSCKNWKYYNKNDIFKYVISSNKDINNLIISLSEGLHEITDIQTFIMDYNSIKNISKEVDHFIIDKDKTKGDIIEGDINVSSDKYFNISIPYDKGFIIYVDGKKVNYEKTDLSFIGFKIKKGKHNIKMVYRAPLLNVGLIISGIGLSIFITVCFKDKKKKVIKKELKKGAKNKQKVKKKKGVKRKK